MFLTEAKFYILLNKITLSKQQIYKEFVDKLQNPNQTSCCAIIFQTEFIPLQNCYIPNNSRSQTKMELWGPTEKAKRSTKSPIEMKRRCD